MGSVRLNETSGIPNFSPIKFELKIIVDSREELMEIQREYDHGIFHGDQDSTIIHGIRKEMAHVLQIEY